MLIQEDGTSALYQIQRYTPGNLWINHKLYQCNVIIRPHALLAPWEPNDFDSIYADMPEILILGTGNTFIIPPTALLAPLQAKGIGVEFMDTKTACFTYIALVCENRSVAACLIV